MNNGYLSTGSTLLNLALTDNPFDGFKAGHYYFLVGDSQSGKTILTLTCCAEAQLNPNFQKYRTIHDDAEHRRGLFDLDKLFGEAMADKIEPPEWDGETPVYSDTVESLYYHLDDAIEVTKKTGRPFIYIVDSQDSLDSLAAQKKFKQHKAHYRKQQARARGDKPEKEGGASKEDDKDPSGSYATEKAKAHSEGLRKLMPRLAETGSILIIISQTRDSLSSYGPSKTRSGGRALRFYATAEIWSSVAEKLTRDVNDKKREIGTRVRLEIKKNSGTGKLSSVEVDIYPDVGFDDVGTMIDFLLEENYWTKEKQTIHCKGLDGVAGTKEKVIRLIEKRNLEDKLRELCGECWRLIAEACAVKRKNRYTATDPEGDSKPSET